MRLRAAALGLVLSLSLVVLTAAANARHTSVGVVRLVRLGWTSEQLGNGPTHCSWGAVLENTGDADAIDLEVRVTVKNNSAGKSVEKVAVIPAHTRFFLGDRLSSKVRIRVLSISIHVRTWQRHAARLPQLSRFRLPSSRVLVGVFANTTHESLSPSDGHAFVVYYDAHHEIVGGNRQLGGALFLGASRTIRPGARLRFHWYDAHRPSGVRSVAASYDPGFVTR